MATTVLHSFSHTSLSPLALLFVGIVLGRNAYVDDTASSWSSMEFLDVFTGTYVVPLYTILVLLYLLMTLLQKQIEDRVGPLESIFFKLLAASKCPPIQQQQQQPSQERVATTTYCADNNNTDSTENKNNTDTDTDDYQPVNLTGAYQLVSNDNFEEFLRVQGVPWSLRSLANKARPIHRITHEGSLLTIQIQGLIESQTTYHINGPPAQCTIRGRVFEDTVHYLEHNGRGILVTKKALVENYHVTVQRVLSDDGQQIRMTSTAYMKDGTEPVVCVQLFQRVE
jgi:hypothetical protein